MRSMPCTIVLSALLGACAQEVAPLPQLEGHLFQDVQGTAPDDVWALGRDHEGLVSAVMQGSLNGSLHAVVPLGAVGPWSYANRFLALSHERLLIVDAAQGEPLELTALDSTGGTKTLDLSALFLDIPDRVVGGTVFTAGARTMILATCTGTSACDGRQRLAELDIDAFVELPGVEWRWQKLAPLAVINGALWLHGSDGYGRYFLKPTAAGWSAPIRPPTTFRTPTELNFTFTSADDLWFDGAHYDGQSWSLPLDGVADVQPDHAGALLSTGPGSVTSLDLRRVGVGVEPGAVSMLPLSLTLDLKPLTHNAQRGMTTRELAAPGCNDRWDCAIQAGGRFGDGSIWFLLGGASSDTQWVLPLSVTDL